MVLNYIFANSILQITYFISTCLFGGNQFTALFKQAGTYEETFLYFLMSEHKIFSGIQLFILCAYYVLSLYWYDFLKYKYFQFIAWLFSNSSPMNANAQY